MVNRISPVRSNVPCALTASTFTALVWRVIVNLFVNFGSFNKQNILQETNTYIHSWRCGIYGRVIWSIYEGLYLLHTNVQKQKAQSSSIVSARDNYTRSFGTRLNMCDWRQQGNGSIDSSLRNNMQKLSKVMLQRSYDNGTHNTKF